MNAEVGRGWARVGKAGALRSASFKGHMAEKRVVNHSGEFHLVRHQQAQNFSCERCMQPKTSKTIVTWIGQDSAEKTICNGCYGFLCAEPKI